DPDDEDARQGGAGEGDLQVQRRKAEVTPELAPVHDVARDAVAASQQLAGACEVARGEGGAHGRAGYALAVGEHAAELLELEAPGRRRRLQRVDVARALRAEAEVVAHQQEAGPQPHDDHLVDERLRREPRERLVEAGDADPVDAAGRQRIELVPLGEDARGGLAAMARREELVRMGLEGEHAAREAAAPGLLDQPPEHRLVPAMDAIVVADRQRAIGALVGGRQAAEDIHGRGGAASGKTLNYKVFAAGLARRPVLESRDEKNRRADIGPWLQHDGAREALPRGALAGPHRRGDIQPARGGRTGGGGRARAACGGDRPYRVRRARRVRRSARAAPGGTRGRLDRARRFHARPGRGLRPSLRRSHRQHPSVPAAVLPRPAPASPRARGGGAAARRDGPPGHRIARPRPDRRPGGGPGAGRRRSGQARAPGAGRRAPALSDGPALARRGPHRRRGPALSPARSARRGGAVVRRRPERLSLAGALETLLERILRFDHPADAQLSRFFREHPGIGRRDRGLLADVCFDVLRNRRLYAHLAQGGSGSLARRLALLSPAAARLARSDEEAAWLERARRVDRASLPAPVRLSLPDWLAERIERCAPVGEFERLGASLLEPAPLDLRVNELKADVPTVLDALAEAGIEARPLPGEPTALRVEGKPALERLAAFADGWFEVQDVGSQRLCRFAAPRRGQVVVDFCAGAGGKTLALAALMRST